MLSGFLLCYKSILSFCLLLRFAPLTPLLAKRTCLLTCLHKTNLNCKQGGSPDHCRDHLG
jgi:hypothetical protein